VLPPPPPPTPLLLRFCGRYPISCKQIKKYCQEILLCLDYLHTEIKDPCAVPAVSPGGAGDSSAAAAAKPAEAAADSKHPKPKAKVMHRDIK
jgi:serine/threonine protein kinase